MPEAERRDEDKLYNKYTLRKLNEAAPKVITLQ